MEKDNSLEVTRIVQRGIGKRELRYGLMRILRVFLGWPTWVLGFAIMTFGFAMAGFTILSADGMPGGITNADYIRCALLVALGFFGIVVIMTGLSMAVPYQFDTFMPGVESERKCMSCGYSLSPRQVFPTCGGCGSWLPLDTPTYFGRCISKMATVINVVVMVATAFLLMAK